MPPLKPDHISPTDDENAAIDAGIAADPDTLSWTRSGSGMRVPPLKSILI